LLCVAVDYHGQAISSTSPASGATSWHPQTIDTGPCPVSVCYSIYQGPPERQLDAVSCPSTSLCVVGDWDGNVLTSTKPTGDRNAWSAAYIDGVRLSGLTGLNPQTPISEVSCPSVLACVATDDDGNVLVSQNPTGGPSTWRISRATPAIIAAPEPSSLYGLGCPSVSFCVGLHANANVARPNSEAALTYHPLAGHAWTSVMIDEQASLTGISCPSSSMCVAIDKSGAVVVGHAPTPAQIRALLTAEITPQGASRRIGSLLHRRAVSFTFNPPTPGSVRIRWLLRLTNKRASRETVRLARSEAVFPDAEAAPLTLAINRAAAARLRHRDHAQLLVEAVFQPLEGQPVTVKEAVPLHR
jgi:hypothetical protein